MAVAAVAVLALIAALWLRTSLGTPRTADRNAAARTAVRATGADVPPALAPDRLAALRAAAALDPCPSSIGRDLPDLVLPCLGGGPMVHLRGPGTGVPTLVNVYGSWCGPCQDEMPTLVTFAGQAGNRVHLLGVDTEDEPSQALPFAHDYGQHWAAVQDDDKAVLRRYASGPPVTLFVDAAGRTVFVHTGPFRGLADLRAAVATHLGVRV